MAKLKIASYIFMTICTLITVITSIILVTSGNYITPIFTTLTVIFAWLGVYMQKRSDDNGHN